MPFQFDNSYARLPEAFHIRTDPTPVARPRIIRVNRDLAGDLGLDAEWLKSPEGLDILSGRRLPEGAEPLAMAYAGHQFGGFVPQLGDGRALLLGEVIGVDGVRRDIHLKGSGPTPFSRRGDGRSALGPVLREYIVSEAMHALGVPTTRALAAVASGELVRREVPLPGGVFTRVAHSHIRVGTFEWFAARGDVPHLRVLADYVINRHYPEAHETDQPYLALLEGVIRRQARLIAQWMSLGFIHGVMNTDNMNISGETIDFGPCAFMDAYHPRKKFSSIDHQGRYAFTNQGPIAHWNLVRLAESLLPLLAEDRTRAVDLAEGALEQYADLHQKALRGRFAAKIGMEGDGATEWDLAQSLLTAMAESQADFTLVFRRLPEVLTAGDDGPLLDLFSEPTAMGRWLETWRNRLTDPEASRKRMQTHNPVFIPRNHRVEEAISAGYQGDFEPFHRLVEVLRRPYEPQPAADAFELPPRPEEVVHATFCGT
jgi:uncharacterized protein YdiU (UPF0061 family)